MTSPPTKRDDSIRAVLSKRGLGLRMDCKAESMCLKRTPVLIRFIYW